MTPKEYARYKVVAVWGHKKEFICLGRLWGKESAWNPKAFNRVKVNGKNAGGIPQILGLDPKMHPRKQVDRGLKYIKHRYDTPCNAWAFWQRQNKKGSGWY